MARQIRRKSDGNKKKKETKRLEELSACDLFLATKKGATHVIHIRHGTAGMGMKTPLNSILFEENISPWFGQGSQRLGICL